MGQAVRGIAGTGSARRDRCPRGGDGDHRGAAERPEAMSDSTPNAVLDGLDYPSRELIASIGGRPVGVLRSEEHTSELQSLMRISYAVFCLKKKNNHTNIIADEIMKLK